MGLVVKQIAVGGFDDNFSYLIYDAESKNAAVVDPCGDLEKILAVVEELELDIVGVLITHTHHDHVDKLAELLSSYRVPVHVHANGGDRVVVESALHTMRDKETLTLGAHQMTVLHTPGHTDDSVCFVIGKDCADDEIPKVITGDTLFIEGCGRTDKEGVRFLFNSLLRLKALPEETEVFPGHDYGSVPVSTIGDEKKHNKYLSVEDFDEFKKLRLS